MARNPAGSFFLFIAALSLWCISQLITVISSMIDTVVLLLPQHAYQITEPDKFVPSARLITRINTRAVHGIQSRQNPTKKELLAGIYKPRLTLFHSANSRNSKEIVLKIELSLPKLFFGNNFQELKGKDLQPLLQRLADTLGQMEVIVDPLELAKAPVSMIHYSKNIMLKDGSTPYHYINKLKESNMKMSLDVNQTDYRNEGHSYKWHCNSYEIVFYDKIKDLEKAKLSDKRAIEKDSAIQLKLFPELVQRKKKLEILRMEVRLNKRQKMKQLFKKLNITSDLTLKSLFNPTMSKKILLHYLDELESKRFSLLDYTAVNDKALLADLIFSNPELSPRRIFQIFGLSKALAAINVRELKQMSKCSKRRWDRIIADAKEIKSSMVKRDFDDIRKKIISSYVLKIFNIKRGFNMSFGFYITNEKPDHYIYLDNNIFRILKRDPAFWNNFFNAFAGKYPEVFEHAAIKFMFSWAQLMEDVDLGQILSKIEQSIIWKKKIVGKKIFGKNDHADTLDEYFTVAREVIKDVPELQKEALLKKIDASILISSKEAHLLVKNTLQLVRPIIEKNNYLDELSFELAWAFITSNPFIKSYQQWVERKTYLDSLIALWHKFASERKEFNFYRLAERHYDNYTRCLLGLNDSVAEKILLIKPIKPLSDLCDAELIYFTRLGIREESQKKVKIIGITFDEEKDILPRATIFNRTLEDLKRDVEGWNVSEVLGEIFCVVPDIIDRTKIIEVKRIRVE